MNYPYRKPDLIPGNRNKELMKSKTMRSNYISFLFSLFFVLMMIQYSNSSSQELSWKRTFGGSREDFAWCSKQSIDGSYLVIGEKKVTHKFTGVQIPQTFILKLNSFGSVIWQRTYGDSLHSNYSYSGVEDESGNIYLASTWDKATLMKTDSEGNLIWAQKFGDSIDTFLDLLIADDDRSIILLGETFNSNANYFTASLTNIDTSGVMLWSKSFLNNAFLQLPINAGKRVLQEGVHLYFSGRSNGKGIIVKTDLEGRSKWLQQYDSVSYLYSILGLGNGNIVSAGFNYIQCIDSLGILLWKNTLHDSVRVFGYGLSKTFDGNIAMVGGSNYSYNKIAIFDTLGQIRTFKYQNYDILNLVRYNSINLCNDGGLILAGDFRVTDQNFPDALVVKTNRYGDITTIAFNTTEVSSNNLIQLYTYPNPSNSSLVVRYRIKTGSKTRIILMNILGQSVREIEYRFLLPNFYIYKFSTEDLNSGTYFLVAHNEKETFTKKILIIK